MRACVKFFVQARSKAPFIVIPDVHQRFDYRCLNQNRRVVAVESRRGELENFHKVLTDISLGKDSNCVRKFIVETVGALKNTALSTNIKALSDCISFAAFASLH